MTMYRPDLEPRSQHGHFQTHLPTLAMTDSSRRSFCVRNCYEGNNIMPESSLHYVVCALLELFFFFKLDLCKILANGSQLQRSINAWQGDNFPASKYYPMFVAKAPTFSQCEAASPLFYSESAISYFCLMLLSFFGGADKEKSPSLCHP